jgi:replicative DNA helicase
MEQSKSLPHDIGLEEFMLTSLMQNKNAFDEVREVLSEKTFYKTFHSEIFKAIVDISERGDSPDFMAVINQMKKYGREGDFNKIMDLSSGSYGFDVYQHALALLQLQKRRDLIELSLKISSMAYDDSEDLADIYSFSESGIKEIISDGKAEVSNMNGAIKAVFEQIQRNHSEAKILTGTPTGFEKFDSRAGGLQKSDLIIIAGDTSQGKTSFSVSIALNAALSDGSIAIYSMEMKKEQIAARMMSIKSGVPANQILYYRLGQEEFEAIDRGISSLYDRKIYFDDRSTSNIDTIISSIRTLKKKYGIDGAIVDYLQILNVNMKGSNPEQQMGTVARRLKNLAKELDIWIIALSQLSRDNSNPVPSLGRLRDSGQIGEAADVVIFIYRPCVYGKSYPEPFKTVSTSGTAMINVAKGRNIGLLKFICGFNEQATWFYDLNEYDYLQQNDDSEPF